MFRIVLPHNSLFNLMVKLRKKNMTIISGKIEPIKKLKETLHSRGIYQFSSIRDVNSFIKQYDSIKQSIPETTKNSLDCQIEDVKLALDNAIKLREKKCTHKVLLLL